LRIFNPCVSDVDVTIEFLPDATNNANSAIHGIEFMLETHGTRIFDDILSAMASSPKVCNYLHMPEGVMQEGVDPGREGMSVIVGDTR